MVSNQPRKFTEILQRFWQSSWSSENHLLSPSPECTNGRPVRCAWAEAVGTLGLQRIKGVRCTGFLIQLSWFYFNRTRGVFAGGGCGSGCGCLHLLLLLLLLLLIILLIPFFLFLFLFVFFFLLLFFVFFFFFFSSSDYSSFFLLLFFFLFFLLCFFSSCLPFCSSLIVLLFLFLFFLVGWYGSIMICLIIRCPTYLVLFFNNEINWMTGGPNKSPRRGSCVPSICAKVAKAMSHHLMLKAYCVSIIWCFRPFPSADQDKPSKSTCILKSTSFPSFLKPLI